MFAEREAVRRWIDYRCFGSFGLTLAELTGMAGAVLIFGALFGTAVPAAADDAEQVPDVVVATRSGVASWYGPKFHGLTTASGERFDMHDLSAAHRTLPFGTLVRVTNEANGESVVVRINDRGPFHSGRLIDLSRKAARTIGLVRRGVARVTVEVLKHR